MSYDAYVYIAKSNDTYVSFCLYDNGTNIGSTLENGVRHQENIVLIQ